MRKLQRMVAVLLSALALTGSAAAVQGCGAGGHLLGGVIAHHILNHVIGRRNANKVFCLYHGHRVIADIRNHHYFIAGLNALAAYHACKGGFGRK